MGRVIGTRSENASDPSTGAKYGTSFSWQRGTMKFGEQESYSLSRVGEEKMAASGWLAWSKPGGGRTSERLVQ